MDVPTVNANIPTKEIVAVVRRERGRANGIEAAYLTYKGRSMMAISKAGSEAA